MKNVFLRFNRQLTQNIENQAVIMQRNISHSLNKLNLMEISILICLWRLTARKNLTVPFTTNDSIEILMNCISKGGDRETCFDYLTAYYLHKSKKFLSKEAFYGVCNCFKSIDQENIEPKTGSLSAMVKSLETCIDKVQLPDMNTNSSHLFNISLFLFSVIWVIYKSLPLCLSKIRCRRTKRQNAPTTEHIDQSNSQLDNLNKSISRIDKKLFELEYDNKLWERVTDIENTQSRLQLLLLEVKNERRNKNYNIKNNNKMPDNCSQLKKSPLVIETKEKGLLFDLTTKQGIEEWANYVNHNSKLKMESKAPDLTPLTLSPISPDISKLNLFDKSGKPFRRIFIPGTGWITRKKCIQIMEELDSDEQNVNSITY